MIKREELLKPTSCLNKALADEPIFVLRAHDKLAPAIVRQWAAAYEKKMESDPLNGTLYSRFETRRAKLFEAQALADQMEKWQAQHALDEAEKPDARIERLEEKVDRILARLDRLSMDASC